MQINQSTLNPIPPTQNTQPTNTPPPTITTPQLTPKKKKPWLIIALVVLLLGATGVSAYKYYELKQQTESLVTPPPLPTSAFSESLETTDSTTPSCYKEENCCINNEDCKYIWFTGGCYTPEYITKEQKENQEKGLRPGEAPPRENVTCTCEANKCVTHG